MSTNEDRIEQSIHVRSSLDRVWLALVDAEQFGSWFGLKLEGSFTPGKSVTGKRARSSVEPESATPPDGKDITIAVETIEPKTRFSFRWHPFAHDLSYDYDAEPTTLVEFSLEEKSDGVLVTVVESGFAKLPGARRKEAFSSHAAGWPIMLGRIGKHVARAQ